MADAKAWNGDQPGACGSCGLVRPMVDGLCSLCDSRNPEPIQTIVPRVMADLATRVPAPEPVP